MTKLKTLTLTFILVAQIFFGQQKEYEKLYNDVMPRLQNIAKNKYSFYNKTFKELYHHLNSKKIKVEKMTYRPRNEERDREYYILILRPLNDELISYAYRNKLANPYIYILFKEQIPVEIEKMVWDTHGIWSEKFANYFANYTIEEIEFYDIRGMRVKYQPPL